MSSSPADLTKQSPGSDFPTVLYQHGNAATRGHSNRVRVGRHMSGYEHNFVIYDYRGFGDSTGTPSETGLVADARRAWDWLTLERSVHPSRVTIMGQSLGTGVSAALAGELEQDGVTPHGLVLVAPFSSLGALLETYRLFNVVPLFSPLRTVPWLLNAFMGLLRARFDTKAVIHVSQCPRKTRSLGTDLLTPSRVRHVPIDADDSLPNSHLARRRRSSDPSLAQLDARVSPAGPAPSCTSAQRGR